MIGNMTLNLAPTPAASLDDNKMFETGEKVKNFVTGWGGYSKKEMRGRIIEIEKEY